MVGHVRRKQRKPTSSGRTIPKRPWKTSSICSPTTPYWKSPREGTFRGRDEVREFYELNAEFFDERATT